MSKYTYSCTKQYFNLPCAHRQHLHQGHCSHIHGYSRSFKFYFACEKLDANHFVFDFGQLKELKEHIEYMCDHTLLINEQDPYLETFQGMHEKGLCNLRVVENCGAEGMARYFLDFAEGFSEFTRVLVFMLVFDPNSKCTAFNIRRSM